MNLRVKCPNPDCQTTVSLVAHTRSSANYRLQHTRRRKKYPPPHPPHPGRSPEAPCPSPEAVIACPPFSSTCPALRGTRLPQHSDLLGSAYLSSLKPVAFFLCHNKLLHPRTGLRLENGWGGRCLISLGQTREQCLPFHSRPDKNVGSVRLFESVAPSRVRRRAKTTPYCI